MKEIKMHFKNEKAVKVGFDGFEKTQQAALGGGVVKWLDTIKKTKSFSIYKISWALTCLKQQRYGFALSLIYGVKGGVSDGL
jgi:hypothetical protein